MGHLREVIPFQYKIVESKKRPGVLMTLEGKLQQVDAKNANGRIYPRKIYEENVLNNEEVKQRMANREMVGTLDHPASGTTSLSCVSHVITDHWLKENGEVWGRVDVLDTPHGQIASKLFEAGVRVGASSRGDGSVTTVGDCDEVQSDYKFETYDLVLKPSTSNAYPRIVESVEDRKENDRLIEKAIRSLVEKTDNKDLLLECHTISGLLDIDHTTLNTMLKEKLSDHDSRNTKPVTPITSKQLEDKMSTKPEQLTEAAAAAYMKEQIEKAVNEAVGAADSEISDLNKRIVEMTKTNETMSKRLKAAEDIINTMTVKLKELRENKTTDATLKKRYDASVKLLEAALKRLPEIKRLRKRVEAAESLLKESLEKHRKEALKQYTESQLKSVPDGMKDKFRRILAECKSRKDVTKVLEGVSDLVTAVRKHRKEPLPQPRNKSLTEERKDNKKEQPKYHSDRLTDAMIRRLGH
jgi:hypothetical protein